MKKTLESGVKENKIYTGTKPKYPTIKPLYQSTSRHHAPIEQNFNSSILNSTFIGNKPSRSSSFNNSMEFNRNLSDEMSFNQNPMMGGCE